MLKFSATNDKNLLDKLSKEIFDKEFDRAVGHVLYDGDKPIGVAEMTIGEDVSVLKKVGIVPEERGKGNGDFFTRSILWGMSQASERIEVENASEYYEKFGFKYIDNGKMSCDSEKIFFPCNCHK